MFYNRGVFIMTINSKMTRGEAKDIVDKIIDAGLEVDEKYADKYNLDVKESLDTGRRQRARLLTILEEYFEVDDC
jgi:hypothetical protein